MSYFATLSFDIAHGTRQNYLDVYSDLAAIGLSSVLRADTGREVRLPTTTCGGEFAGTSSLGVIFIIVGAAWGWIHERF